jgi:nitric oxide reductase subunit C
MRTGAHQGEDHATGRIARRILPVIAGYVLYAFLVATLPGRADDSPAPAEHAALPSPPVSLIEAGRLVWQACRCQACHSIYGLGGHTGPDLTNVARRASNELIKAQVRAGGAVMPAFDLNDDEAAALAAYLRSVDATGTYPPSSIRAPVFGER